MEHLPQTRTSIDIFKRSLKNVLIRVVVVFSALETFCLMFLYKFTLVTYLLTYLMKPSGAWTTGKTTPCIITRIMTVTRIDDAIDDEDAGCQDFAMKSSDMSQQAHSA